MLVDTVVSVRLEKLAMIVIKVSESVADPGFPKRRGLEPTFEFDPKAY